MPVPLEMPADGKDHLYGGEGNDLMLGGRAIDELHGDTGNDELHGGGINDGGKGYDDCDMPLPEYHVYEDWVYLNCEY